MLQPSLLYGGAVRDPGVEGIIPDDVLAGSRADAVARVGVPGIRRGLRPVFLHRKAFQRASIGTEVRQLIDHRNGEQRLGAAVGARGCDSVGRSAGRAATVGVSLEIPVSARRVRVDLPVVPAGGVSAPAIERGIQGRHIVRIPVGDAVDIGIDGMPVGVGIHTYRCRRILRKALDRTEQNDHRQTHSVAEHQNIRLARVLRHSQTGKKARQSYSILVRIVMILG